MNTWREIMSILLSCLKQTRMPYICLGLFLAGSVSAREWIDRPWKDDIIYFMMTDRFHDGDPENNVPSGSDPALYDAAQKNISLYHGGDFRGIEKALLDGYFTDLGISAIWITPPVRNAWFSMHDLGGSKSGYHGYWAQDFRDIDPHLASKTDLAGKSYKPGREGRLQHYKELIDLAHSKDIKIVQDIVCNHIGPLFYYDLDGNGKHDGKAKEWMPPYKKDSTYLKTARWADEPKWNVVKPGEFFRNLDLYWGKGFSPDSLGKTDGEEQMCDFFSLRALNTSPTAPHFDRLVDEFVDIYHFYINELGVDGLRIDTVKHVDKKFWDEFASRLRKRLGDDADRLIMFGEVYGNSIADINYYTRREDRSDQWSMDGLLDFQFTYAIRDYLRHAEYGNAYKLAEFFQASESQVKGVGKGDAADVRRRSVNFIGNHDGLNRFLVKGVAEENNLLALSVMLTAEGIPCIYYGSELSLRDTQAGTERDSETGRFTLFDNAGKRGFAERKKNPGFGQLADLIRLRESHQSLVQGGLAVLQLGADGASLQDGVACYLRGGKVNAGNRSACLVLVNAGNEAVKLQADALRKAVAHSGIGGRVPLQLIYSNGAVPSAQSKVRTFCNLPPKTLQVYLLSNQ